LESAENVVNEPPWRVIAEGDQKKSRVRLRVLVEELPVNGPKEIGQPRLAPEACAMSVVVMGRAGIEPATLGLKVPCSTD
jgi:hypothetical protein